MCEKCGKRIEATSNNRKFCKECWKEQERQIRKDINRRYYEKRKFKTV